MKNIIKCTIALIVLLMISCKEEPTLGFVEGSRFEVAYGDTVKLTLKYTPEDAFLSKVLWKSSDNRVVTRRVLEGTSPMLNGFYYAVGIGAANISAEAEINGESIIANCQVDVKEIMMTSLQIDSTTCTLKLGGKAKLTATYEPSNTSFPNLSWSSSDDNIATVNSEGVVSARKIGECTITVSDKKSGLKSQCQVIVSPIEMTSLKLNETDYSIEIGNQFKLTATFEPKNATFHNLYWYSSDESVANVSSEGDVNAISKGSCVISVKNKENNLTAQCNVDVYVVEMTKISCTKKKTIEQGESFILSASYSPSNATTYGNALRWHSSNESIAIVDELTGQVESVGFGECSITISNIYNSVTTSCLLTIKPAKVKSLSLNKDEMYLPIGESEQFECTIIPEYAYDKNVKWETSDNSVITVSEEGVVTAVGLGKAIIKVTALDGSGCTSECLVCVGTENSVESYLTSYIYHNVSMTDEYYDSKWHFKVTNNGAERLYLKEIKGFRPTTAPEDLPVLYKEGVYIEPGETFEYNTWAYPIIIYYFEMYGGQVGIYYGG